MPFGVGIRFDLRDLTRQLELKGKNVRSATVKALRAAAQPVIAEARAILAAMTSKAGWEHTGLTAKAIGVVSVGKKRGAPGVVRLRIGARPGYRTNKKTGAKKATGLSLAFRRKAGGRTYVHVPANILHFLELGTQGHAVGQGSQVVIGGRRNPRPGPQHGNQHPGARAYPSLKPAVERRQAEAQAIAAEVLRKIIES
jgi:hypothetical protein